MINEKAVQYNPFERSFRIVGTIWDTNSPKYVDEPLGYFLLDETSVNIKPFSSTQVKTLLNGFKFSNAKLESDKIVNTECSMFNLPKFNKQLKPIEDIRNIYQVLSEVNVDGSSAVGYRVMGPISSNTSVAILSEGEVVKLKETGKAIPNVKIVESGDKKIVSGIKSSFNTLTVKNTKSTEKAKVDTSNKEKMLAGENYRKQQAVEHIERSALNVVRYMVRCKPRGSYVLYIPKGLKKSYADILMNEVFIPSRGYNLSDNDKMILRDSCEHFDKVSDRSNCSYIKKCLAASIAQFALCNSEYRDMIFNEAKSVSKLNAHDKNTIKMYFKDLAGNKRLSKGLLNILDKLGRLGVEVLSERAYTVSDKDKEFNTEESINKLGFTFDKSKNNTYLNTKAKRFKIKYIGNYFGLIKHIDADDIKSEVLNGYKGKHFGDVAAAIDMLVLIDKAVGVVGVGPEVSRLSLGDIKKRLEFLIVAAKCNKSELITTKIVPKFKKQLIRIGVSDKLLDSNDFGFFGGDIDCMQYYFNSGFRALMYNEGDRVKHINSGRKSLNTPMIADLFVSYRAATLDMVVSSLSGYFKTLTKLCGGSEEDYYEAALKIRTFS